MNDKDYLILIETEQVRRAFSFTARLLYLKWFEGGTDKDRFVGSLLAKTEGVGRTVFLNDATKRFDDALLFLDPDERDDEIREDKVCFFKPFSALRRQVIQYLIFDKNLLQSLRNSRFSTT